MGNIAIYLSIENPSFFMQFLAKCCKIMEFWKLAPPGQENPGSATVK